MTSTLARGVYLQLSIPVPQMRSGLPSYVPPSAHDWGQVLMFEGKTCSHSRAFTTWHVLGWIDSPGGRNELGTAVRPLHHFTDTLLI